MRGINRRGLRLDLVAGLIIALALPALAAPPLPGAVTTTTLTAGTLPAGSCSQPLAVAVTSGGAPVTSGSVAIMDEFNGNAVTVATLALSSTGTASPTVDLSAGSHSLTAVFAGNTSYQASTSTPAVAVSVATECEFSVAITSLTPSSSTAGTITLTPGQSGSATVTVTPSVEFTSALAAPMSVEISCSGLPDGATCIPTPENLQILSTTPESCPSGSPASACPPTSNMLIETYAAGTASATPPQGKGSTPIAWAILLPGALCLGGLAFGARRRRWLSRLSLLALVGLVTLLGTTACNPRYYYLNHGPQPNLPTPAGTYTVTVTAQTNNGVTTTSHATSFVLVVN
ncbi:MAG: Ig-like domain-containing protein [Terracidiphilus sp.]